MRGVCNNLSQMADNTTAQPTEQPPRRRARRWWFALGVAALALAGWWFGVELPERRAAAELKRQQAEKSFRIADLGLDMVWIPPGTFRMGTSAQSAPVRWFYDLRAKITDRPNPDYQHTQDWPATWVMLTRPFWLGRTEVTQAQWQAIMGDNPSYFKGEDLPVENVLWEDAMEFCRKLTERERAVGHLPKGYAYTLPTEAQWEYTCRGGTIGDYAGDLDALAWYNKNSGGMPHPVGTKQANEWGLYDMEGNVWELCTDWLDDYPGGDVTNPKGPSSSLSHSRVIRGGSWFNSALEGAHRDGNTTGDRSTNIGFRLALAPAAVASPAPAATTKKN